VYGHRSGAGNDRWMSKSCSYAGVVTVLREPAIYLDHAATTPLRHEALAAMEPWLTGGPANPSGSHHLARAARRAVDDARDAIAGVVGCESGELVFTAGGTEADNLAVLGVHRARGGALWCSAVEHAAVLQPCLSVGGSTIPVDGAGTVQPEMLADLLGPEVSLVSVMTANNEVGTVQPIEKVVATIRELSPGTVIHSDAVGALAWLDVAALTSGCDLVSVAAHKVGGPHGVGALVVRAGTPVAPVLLGGSQERGRRPGTVDVAGVVGMAAAVVAAGSERAELVRRVARLRRRLVDGLEASGCGARPTLGPGFAERAVSGIAHLVFPGVAAEELLMLLDRFGICASAGAACASGAAEPSHVLLAMGLSPDEARRAVRFSLGRTTTDQEIDQVVRILPGLVEQLRDHR